MKRIALVLAPLLLVAALGTPTKAQAPTAAPPSASSPAATPSPTPSSSAPASSAGDKTIADLRKEYEALREELFASRSKAAAVGGAVFSSRLRVHLRYLAGRFYDVRRATIRVDGVNVYDDTAGAIAGDDAPRFEGFVAPGRHLVTIRLEAHAKDDDRFLYTVEDSFTVDVPQKQTLILHGRAEDAGDIAHSWKRNAKGSYKLRLDVSAEAKTEAAASGAKAAK
jgi:ribosomal protein L29